MTALTDYVATNTIRGDCTCGVCIDRVAYPEHPSGHTIDLTFFKVGAAKEANAQTLLALVKTEQPHYLNGKEHSYIEIGGDLGDQGAALMLIGLGHVLKLWQAMAPETMMPFLDSDLKMTMAQNGLVALRATLPVLAAEEA